MHAHKLLGAALLVAVPAYRMAGTAVPAHGHARPTRTAGALRLSQPPPPRTTVVPQRAVGVLSRLMDSAIKNLRNSDAPLVLKTFSFSARARSVRTLEALGGRSAAEYMQLPIESYALYDDNLMRRVTDDEFVLCLPLDADGLISLRPTIRVRVAPDTENSIRISSIAASLYGLPTDAEDVERAIESASPGDATAAAAELGEEEPDSDLESEVAAPPVDMRQTLEEKAPRFAALSRSVKLSFNTTLSWIDATSSAEGATEVTCQTSVALALGLPPPFTVVPRLIVQGAGSAIMRSVTDLILPQFVNLLEKDYTRWANGTRDASVSVGTLMDVESVSVDAGGGDDGAST